MNTVNSRASFEVLGPMRVTRGLRSWEPNARHQQLTLGLLTVRAGQHVSRDEIRAELWAPGEVPGSSWTAMQVYVHHLRTGLLDLGLAREMIRTVPGGYRLDLGDSDTDIAQFKRIAAHARVAQNQGAWVQVQRAATDALSLWRGGFLMGMAAGPVLTACADEYNQIRWEMQEALATALLARGDNASAITHLLQLIAVEPARESLRVKLITAYWRADMRDRAVKAFDEARSAIQDEMGLPLGQSMTDLNHKMLHGGQI
jgi:DNA-binding SARP family transcriptional activator